MSKEINDIIARDKQAFEEFVALSPLPLAHLEIPPSVLRYMCLPERLFQVVRYPLTLDVILASLDQEPLRVAVYESTPDPITWRADYDRWRRSIRKVGIKSDASNVDPMFITHHELIDDGQLKLADRILLAISMITFPQGGLHIVTYQDRLELRKKGVALAFYTRLRWCAQQLGFRFLTGRDTDSPDQRVSKYFKHHMGRYSLDELRREKQEELITHHPDDIGIDEKGFTIDFLRQNDISRFVKPEVLARSLE